MSRCPGRLLSSRRRHNAPRRRGIVCSQHITSLSRRAERDRDSENTTTSSTRTTPSPRTNEYLCVSNFLIFLSRLVVSTVVATLAVHASSPIFSTTTHYSYNPMGPAEGVYTCARPEAPSSVPRLTKHSRSMSRASNRPRPQLAREDRKKSGGSITESQKGLPGRAGRGRWAAREVAGGQRRAAARRELHGVIRRRDMLPSLPAETLSRPFESRAKGRTAHHSSSPPQQTILTRTRHSPRPPRRFSP